ncbi:DUF3566 domain-containing protein [Streptomyces sp. TRM 70361]|uniref:DUF3566 domain-containing protein n=1 Tax=Streptomyces sp. TRM 70361 TaxID=3116553 RepID=UPI002E7B6B1F|nr:DUF3566 domain-containing protein [Streptomyces sp. TRM 70361]MEE1939509.1 DUF3566 domain-containing protein [Streptomyces sp. TRM 70361]
MSGTAGAARGDKDDGGARGPAADDTRRKGESHRGGTTVTSAQPQPPAQPQAGAPQPQPQPQPQPHQPPQAYPSPPGGTPPPRSGRPHQPGADQQAAPQPGQQQSDMDVVRRPRTGARTVPRTRKARLRVAKADPWSVMKVSFLLSIALGICTVAAVAVLWMVMDAMGVFAAIGGTVSEATATDDGGGFDLEGFLSLSRVLAFTSIVAVIDVVLVTALATLGAFIYNLSAGFVGGVEVTLAEDE